MGRVHRRHPGAGGNRRARRDAGRAAEAAAEARLMTRLRTSRAAFTLVELLVVIGIITVLLGLLMPMMARARQQAQLTACKSNLRSIGQALEMYSNDYRRFPDGITSGNFAYRMRPGFKTAGDPGALPETYGLAAVLHGIQPGQDISGGLPKPKYISGVSEVWVCPS